MNIFEMFSSWLQLVFHELALCDCGITVFQASKLYLKEQIMRSFLLLLPHVPIHHIPHPHASPLDDCFFSFLCFCSVLFFLSSVSTKDSTTLYLAFFMYYILDSFPHQYVDGFLILSFIATQSFTVWIYYRLYNHPL